MIHQRNVPHVCQHVYVMGGYIRPPDESEGYRYILPNLPRGLLTVWAASVLNGLICHPVTTRFIGGNDRHHHHICHADKHHILFSAWVRLVICLFSSDIFTSWFYTGYFVWFLMCCLSAWQMKWVGISGPLMNQGVTGWQMVSRVSHNTPPYPIPNRRTKLPLSRSLNLPLSTTASVALISFPNYQRTSRMLLPEPF